MAKPEYVNRMEAELLELNSRIQLLYEFVEQISGDAYSKLPPIDQMLLRVQYAAMQQYQQVLQVRLLRA